MTRTRKSLITVLCLSSTSITAAFAQDLQSFGIVSGESFTNTGSTTINGNIAVYPGTSYSGSGTVTQTGSTYLGDAVALRMHNSMTTLYNFLAGRSTSTGGDLTGQELGGQTLSFGVYNFDTSAQLSTGQTLILDGGGNPDAVFIFNIGTTLTVGSGANLALINGAQGGNVFFRVGSSATLDTTALMQGQIVALTSITLNTEAELACGAAFAQNGSITLDTNTITTCVLSATEFEDVLDETDLSENATSVATSLALIEAGGGDLPISFAILPAAEDAEALDNSLRQLSGEVSTAIAPSTARAADGFLDMVMRSGTTTGNASAVGGGAVGTAADDDIPPGMVLDTINAPYIGKYGSEATAPLSFAAVLGAAPRSWDMWASAYGWRSVTDGDAGLGAQDLTASGHGLAAGVNFLPSEATNFGVALSLNTSSFYLGNDFGSGESDTVFLAFRGRTSSDRGYLEGALAYGHGDVTTDRIVTVAGADRFTAETTAKTWAGHIEAGRHMGRITTFAGLRAISVKTPAYSETTVAGSSSYALAYDATTTNTLRSELGVSLSWPSAKSTSSAATFGVRAAWAHEFASDNGGNRSFIAIPGSAFSISGARRDADSLLLSASVDFAGTDALQINGTVNADISQNRQDLGASLLVGYRW